MFDRMPIFSLSKCIRLIRLYSTHSRAFGCYACIRLICLHQLIRLHSTITPVFGSFVYFQFICLLIVYSPVFDYHTCIRLIIPTNYSKSILGCTPHSVRKSYSLYNQHQLDDIMLAPLRRSPTYDTWHLLSSPVQPSSNTHLTTHGHKRDLDQCHISDNHWGRRLIMDIWRKTYEIYSPTRALLLHEKPRRYSSINTKFFSQQVCSLILQDKYSVSLNFQFYHLNPSLTWTSE